MEEAEEEEGSEQDHQDVEMMMMDPVTSSRFTDQDQQLKAATPRMAPLPTDSATPHHPSKRSASDSPVTEVCL